MGVGRPEPVEVALSGDHRTQQLSFEDDGGVVLVEDVGVNEPQRRVVGTERDRRYGRLCRRRYRSLEDRVARDGPEIRLGISETAWERVLSRQRQRPQIGWQVCDVCDGGQRAVGGAGGLQAVGAGCGGGTWVSV